MASRARANAVRDPCSGARDSDPETIPTRGRRPTEIIGRWPASNDESNDAAFHSEPLQTNPECLSKDEDSDEHELALPRLEEYTRLIVQDPGHMWILTRLYREIITTETKENFSLEIRRAHLHATLPTKHVNRIKSPDELEPPFAVN
ncbi:hypothetical protein F4803DRAFT_550598 [Xylaria telfairii]|nr:hypothetical protein F4803DRAFT_550598 [Xylaria telfairii]